MVSHMFIIFSHFRLSCHRSNLIGKDVSLYFSLKLNHGFLRDRSVKSGLKDSAFVSQLYVSVLDAYFSVLVFHGMTIAHWRTMDYQNHPEYQVFIFFSQDFLLSGYSSDSKISEFSKNKKTVNHLLLTVLEY